MIYSRDEIIDALIFNVEDYDIKTMEEICKYDLRKTLESYSDETLKSEAIVFELMNETDCLKKQNETGLNGFFIKEDAGGYYIYKEEVLLINVYGDIDLAQNILTGLKQGIL